jgi:general stress protein 26
MDIQGKAAALLGECADITLASVNENGYPRICAMGRAKFEGVRKIWFATGLTGTKVRHFNENPKASVCFWKGCDSVTLTGKAAVRTDRQIREELWIDASIKYFPGGIDDPNYCIVEFTAEEGTFWIDGEFVTMEVSDNG